MKADVLPRLPEATLLTLPLWTPVIRCGALPAPIRTLLFVTKPLSRLFGTTSSPALPSALPANTGVVEERASRSVQDVVVSWTLSPASGALKVASVLEGFRAIDSSRERGLLLPLLRSDLVVTIGSDTRGRDGAARIGCGKGNAPGTGGMNHSLGGRVDRRGGTGAGLGRSPNGTGEDGASSLLLSS